MKAEGWGREKTAGGGEVKGKAVMMEQKSGRGKGEVEKVDRGQSEEARR